jgi:hypothetical protein
MEYKASKDELDEIITDEIGSVSWSSFIQNVKGIFDIFSKIGYKE